MSEAIPSLTLSIQGLELQPEHYELGQISCQVFLNHQKVSALDISELSDSYTFCDVNTTDLIQIKVIKSEEQDQIASISFLARDFLKRGQSEFAQWVTLMDNPDDDLYEGNLNKEQQELPRVLISVDMIADFEKSPESKSKVANNEVQISTLEKESFEKTLSEGEVFEKESDLPNFRVSELERLDENQAQRTSHKSEIEESPDTKKHRIEKSLKDSPLLVSRDSINNRESGEFTESFSLPAKKSGQEKLIKESHVVPPPKVKFQEGDRKSGLGSSDNPMKTLNQNFAKEIAKLNEKLRQANHLAHDVQELKNVLVYREGSNTEQREKEPVDEEFRKKFYDLELQNEMLTTKVQNLQHRTEYLRRENGELRKKENVYTNDLYRTRTLFEKAQVTANAHERYAKALEQKVSDAQNQVEIQIQSRLNMEREKEKAYHDLSRIQQKYEDLKRQSAEENKQSVHNVHENFHQMSSKQNIEEGEREGEGSKYINKELMLENLELKNRILEMESKAKEYQSTVHGFREKLESLKRDYNDQSARNELKEKESSQLATMSSLLKEMKEKLDEQSRKRNGDNEKLPNEDESESQTVLIVSLQGHIEDLKAHVAALENEKSNLKEELHKANENYAKLTAKYIEMTETLTHSKRTPHGTSVNESQDLHSEKDELSSLRNNSHFEEDIEEVEIKLQEFLNANNISPANFRRLDKNSYTFCGRKIVMKVMNGKLFVRGELGANFKTIDEFWKDHKGKSYLRTPSLTSRGHDPSNKNDEKNRQPTPERKLHHSFILNKLENEKVDESMDKHNISKDDDKETNRSFVADSQKSARDAKIKSENIRPKNPHYAKLLDKKPTATTALNTGNAKTKGKSARDLTLGLGNQYKQF